MVRKTLGFITQYRDWANQKKDGGQMMEVVFFDLGANAGDIRSVDKNDVDKIGLTNDLLADFQGGKVVLCEFSFDKPMGKKFEELVSVAELDRVGTWKM